MDIKLSNTTASRYRQAPTRMSGTAAKNARTPCVPASLRRIPRQRRQGFPDFVRRHWYRLVPLVLLTLTVAILIMIAVLSGNKAAGKLPFVDESKVQSSVFPETIASLPVITELLPEGSTARPGILREIKFLVIHETGNEEAGADAAAHNDYIKREAATHELAWHYTVDDKVIYHHMPDNEAARHTGDPEGDGGGIGIELCVNKDGSYDLAFKNAAVLCAYLIDSYDLDPGEIYRHSDFGGENCLKIMDQTGRWDEFKALVRDIIE